MPAYLVKTVYTSINGAYKQFFKIK